MSFPPAACSCPSTSPSRRRPPSSPAPCSCCYRHGHLQGDECLRELAQLCAAHVRDGSDLAARYGGEEVVILLPRCGMAEAMRVELKSRRIAVTSVHPIMTTTEFGKVAESDAGTKLPRGNALFTQTAEHVGRTMVRAIVRPGREVWPHRPTR